MDLSGLFSHGLFEKAKPSFVSKTILIAPLGASQMVELHSLRLLEHKQVGLGLLGLKAGAE